MAEPLDEDRRALAAFDELAAQPQARRENGLAALPGALQERVRRMLAALDSPTLLPPAPGARLHRAGERIAAWVLAECVGRGGMAEVWRGEPVEGRLRREVALKLPLHSQGSLVERFARERDVLMALDHPHIARLYDAGADAQGQPFLALELVRGVPITHFAERRGLDTPARLQLALQVLDALAHAHRRLVVHRDLKPSNVLVTPQGQVKLLDFGIAKLLGPQSADAALTHDASQLLTPRYAAPEQVGEGSITTATDLYAFGVMLYELLTGRLPYAGRDASLAQALHAVLHAAPDRPGLSPDLDAVILKCLAKQPESRYASAERLIDDLRAVLQQRPVSARRSHALARARLWVRRNRWAAAGSVLALALTGTALALALNKSLEARAQSARGDAVRRFINDMMSEVEPRGGQHEVSGADLLVAAVRQAQQSFAEAPRTRAEILGELGRVQIRLQQWDAARATLDQALVLFERHAPAGDPLHNRSRAYLATLQAWRGGKELAQAGALARRVLADCPLPDPECALSHGSAHYALWRIAAWRDDAQEGLRQALAMVQASRLAPAQDLPQRVDALETLAAAALYGGRLAQARQALREVQDLTRNTAPRTANQHRLRWLTLVLDGLEGDPRPAAEALAAMADQSGSETERTRVLNAAVQLELMLARPERALATASAVRYEAAGIAASSHLAGRSLALLQLGRAAEAAAALEAAESLAGQADLVPASPLLQRLRRQRAQLHLLRGESPAARVALQGLEIADNALDAARALALRACLHAASSQPEAARAAIGQALLQLPLAADHPLRRRLQLLQSQLQPQSAQQGATLAALAALRRVLPADSAWQRQAPGPCALLP